MDNMPTWRNRLAQESYTFKVVGSSPAVGTMRKCLLKHTKGL